MSDPVTSATELCHVELRQFPLDLYRRSAEHHEELMREFALIALQPPSSASGQSVPHRLIALIKELDTQYAAAVSTADQEREAALERGDAEIDLCYDVPPQAREASKHLDDMLREADEYCRRGQHLLTLASPPDAVAFRKWYVGEFLAQIDGAPPTPWPVYAQRYGVLPVS